MESQIWVIYKANVQKKKKKIVSNIWQYKWSLVLQSVQKYHYALSLNKQMHTQYSTSQ